MFDTVWSLFGLCIDDVGQVGSDLVWGLEIGVLYTTSGWAYVTCAGGHTCFAATSQLARHDQYTGAYIVHSLGQTSESGFRRFGIFACPMGLAGRSVGFWANDMWRRAPTFVCFYRFQQDISSSLYLYQAAKMYNLCRFTNKLCLVWFKRQIKKQTNKN